MHLVIRIAIGSLLLVANATLAGAQPKFAAIHGASAAKYQDWTNGLAKQKLRPAFVSVAEIDGAPTFAAIAVDNNEGRTWAVSHHLSAQEYQQEFLAQVDQGLRPICVVGYRKGDVANYAAIFVKDNVPQWSARHGLDANQYQQTFDHLGKAGYRPVQGSVYPAGESVQYSYLFVKDNFKDWIAQAGLTVEQYQKLLSDPNKKNVRPISVCAYPTKFGTRFAAIVVEDAQKLNWSSKHHLTPKQYQEYYNDMTGKGYRPTQVCAYPWENEVRYLAVFEKAD